MMHEKFPFTDFEKMTDMFKMPELDKMFDTAAMPSMDVVIKAHEKNMNAAIEANKVAMAGYQAVYKRQISMVEESMAQAKDAFSDLQGQPMTSEQAQKNVDAGRIAFEKAVKDMQELTELSQKASTEAFEVVKARFEEAMAEFQTIFDQAQPKKAAGKK
ncbi:MAG: phasin family protein [Pseudomonadota bacterium]